MWPGGSPEGDSQLPLKAERALTAPACSLPQLSGLLQVCVRTGTETQAKFTSVELLREYISVRNWGPGGAR